MTFNAPHILRNSITFCLHCSFYCPWIMDLKLKSRFPRIPCFELWLDIALQGRRHTCGEAYSNQIMDTNSSTLRVGVVGYGHLGQFLVDKLLEAGAGLGLVLGFVWNRNPNKLMGSVPAELILDDLSSFANRRCDVIVEVCHPQIVRDFGLKFLSEAHFMVGSPSALSDPDLNQKLRQASLQHGRTLYIPSGALWGGQDIQRMNDSGTLKALFIRMSKHPSCFRLTGDVLSDWTEGEGRRVLFRGSVVDLCPLAPNNVNTMAAAAVAAGKLGFTGVQGEIVSDTALKDFHVVEVEVTGPDGFSVHTVRRNPAKLGAVTGSATYNSFWNSLLICRGHGGRVYLC